MADIRQKSDADIFENHAAVQDIFNGFQSADEMKETINQKI